MNKIIFFIVTFFLFTLFSLSEIFADPYINSQFPPYEIIEKIIIKHYEGGRFNPKFNGFVGKHQESENVYTIFFKLKNNANVLGDSLWSFTVIRLDSNVWTYRYDGLNYLVQK